MAVTSYNDLIAEMAAGKKYRLPFNRTIQTGATSVAGRWHEAMTGLGTGGSLVSTGTAGLGAPRTQADAGSLPQPNNLVTPDTKFLATMRVGSPSTTLTPGLAQLIDLLYVYPSCVVTGTPSTISNAAAKPTRHNNGIGVQLGAMVVGALGAATPTLTCSYTDSAGNAGNSTTLAASANSLPVGALLTNAVAGTLGNPQANLAAGDIGVRSLDSYTIGSGTTGTVTFFLYREIAEIPLTAANVHAERDFISQLMSMPNIDEDAFLGFLVNIGGALTTNQVIGGNLGAGWG
jgi:hypothetical protein